MISRKRSGSRPAASAVESARSAKRTVTIFRSSPPSGAGAAVDERHFAEVVSGPEPRLRVVADEDVRFPFEDEVEADACGALLDDLATGGVLDLLGRAHDGLEFLVRQALEDRNRLEHRLRVAVSSHSGSFRMDIGIIDETSGRRKTASSTRTVYSRDRRPRTHDILREDAYVARAGELGALRFDVLDPGDDGSSRAASSKWGA